MRLGRSRTHTRTHTQTVDCVQFGGPAPPVDSFFGFAHAFAKARQLAQARPFLSTVRSTARAFLFKMSSWVGPGNVTVFDAVYRPSISSSPRRKPVSSIFQDRRLHMDLLDRAPQGHPGKGSPVNSIFQVLNIVRSRNFKSKTHTQHTHTHIHTYTHTQTGDRRYWRRFSARVIRKGRKRPLAQNCRNGRSRGCSCRAGRRRQRRGR